MATLQAASRSLQGSSRCKGVWGLGLCAGGDSCRSQPRASGLRSSPAPQHSVQTPAAQHVSLEAVLHPPPCNFLLQGDSWSRGLGSGVAPRSAADLGII